MGAERVAEHVHRRKAAPVAPGTVHNSEEVPLCCCRQWWQPKCAVHKRRLRSAETLSACTICNDKKHQHMPLPVRPWLPGVWNCRPDI